MSTAAVMRLDAPTGPAQVGPAGSPRHNGTADRPRAVLERFVDVPQFLRVLTEGDDALYRLPAAVQDDLVALDLGAMRALIVARAGDPATAGLRPHVASLRAHLLTSGYQVEDRQAVHAVIGEIRRHPGQREQSANAGTALQRFQRWIEIAERMEATDMHAEVRGNVAQVRVRVDGRLFPLDDGAAGRYSKQEALAAMGAAFNSTRTGNTGSHYEPDQFVNCVIAFNTPRCSGQARYQNIPGRLGPKVIVRLLRMREESR